MELKQLSFFKRTAELEHMSRAAEELLVSQPYLSKTISDLEGELGAPLFDHKGRNIVLNYCGKAFYAHEFFSARLHNLRRYGKVDQ